jgi:hypothetical protein
MGSVVVTSRLPAAQLAKLDAIAKDLGLSRAEAIQVAIAQWLKGGAKVPKQVAESDDTPTVK